MRFPDNASLGQFEFSGFDKGLRSDVKIDVTFEIDADGIVNVTASDQATGQEASTQITLSSGLGEEQIEQLIEQAREFRPAVVAVADETGRAEVAAAAAARQRRNVQQQTGAPPVETYAPWGLGRDPQDVAVLLRGCR